MRVLGYALCFANAMNHVQQSASSGSQCHHDRKAGHDCSNLTCAPVRATNDNANVTAQACYVYVGDHVCRDSERPTEGTTAMGS